MRHSSVFFCFISISIGCCSLLETGVCRNGGAATFGGRLMWTRSDDQGREHLPTWVNGAGKIVFFQKPPGLTSRSHWQRASSGRGEIWMGKKSCAGGPFCQQSYALHDKPCLDDSVPCYLLPPSYSGNRTEILQFFNITPTSVTVTWPAWDEVTDHGFGPVIEYKIQIKEKGSDNFRTVSVGLDLSHQFVNLTEDTEYDFRVVVVRDHPPGEGPPSTTQIQKTPVKEPPSYSQSRVAPLQFSDVTPTSITVTWPAWDQSTDLGSGPIAEYKVQIRERGAGNFNDTSVGLGISHQFVNLTEDTEYEFRVVIVRDHPTGEGAPSRIQTKRTSGKVCRNGGAATFGGRLMWTRSDGQGREHLPTWVNGAGKIVFFQKPPGLTSRSHWQSASSGRGEIWMGKRSCAGGPFCQQSYALHDKPCLDDSVPCYLPPPSYSGNRTEILQFFNITPTSVTVTWPAWDEVTDQGFGPVIEYKIQIKGTGSDNFRTVSVGLDLSHQFVNLTEDTEYDFRVVVVRDHPPGEGPPSTTQILKTPVKVAPSYSEEEPLLFSDVTPTSITVTWPAWDQATDLGSGPIAEYKVQIREHGADNFNDISVGLGMSYQFVNLTENTEYEFRVVIVRDHPTGEGPPSKIQTQGTPHKLRDEDLSLHLESQSKFVGLARLIASWEISAFMTSLGDIHQTLLVERRDLDGCKTLEGPPASERNMSLSSDDRRRALKGRKPNSLYQVTLVIRYSTGDWYSRSALRRTAESFPTAAPSNVTARRTARRLLHFKWAEPPCGSRNGNIVRYEFIFNKNGHEMSNVTPLKQKYFNNMSSEDRYSFKVRAYTSRGPGQYSEPIEGIFGKI